MSFTFTILLKKPPFKFLVLHLSGWGLCLFYNRFFMDAMSLFPRILRLLEKSIISCYKNSQERLTRQQREHNRYLELPRMCRVE